MPAPAVAQRHRARALGVSLPDDESVEEFDSLRRGEAVGSLQSLLELLREGLRLDRGSSRWGRRDGGLLGRRRRLDGRGGIDGRDLREERRGHGRERPACDCGAVGEPARTLVAIVRSNRAVQKGARRIWSPPGAREREAASAACAARLDAPRSVGAMDITLSSEPFARAEARRGAV